MKTIGFSGKMGSGKDYTANLVAEKIKLINPNVKVGFLTYASTLRIELDCIADKIKQKEDLNVIAKEMNVAISELEHLLNLFLSDNTFWDENYSTFNRTPKAREILQYWGTDVRRKQDNNYWVTKTKEIALKSNFDYLLITDVRFPNEAQGVNDLNGIVIECWVPDDERIKRLEARGVKMTKETLKHSSETSMENYNEFDLKVNTGSPNADDKIIKLLRRKGCL